MQNSEYNIIDLVKVCMAFIVVAIHTHPQNSCTVYWIRELLTNVYDLAVPFFFVASGFLLGIKICDAPNDEKLFKLKGYIWKTARLYVLWTFVYLPFTIYGCYIDGLGYIKSVAVFARNFLLVGENYMSWPLWYLLAVLVAVSLIYLMVKCNFNVRTMCLVGIFLVFLGYCLDKNIIPSSIYTSLFKTTRNGFFVGLPYILIGMLIASKKSVSSVPKGALLSMLFVSFLFYVLGYKLAMFVVVYSFFSLILQIDLEKAGKDLYRNLRLTSTVIYFVHMLWVGIIIALPPLYTLSPILSFFVVAIMSLATAVIVVKKQDVKVVKLLFR